LNVSPRAFLWVSLSLHVAVGMAVYGKPAPTRAESARTGPPPSPQAEAIFHGNTFEVPIDVPATTAGNVRDELPAVSVAPAARARSAGRLTESALSGARSKSEGDESGGSGTGAGVATVFGATGERASVDLATAFTRGFPQAASADPVWVSAPFGAAGEATVVLVIDESGTLVDSRIEGAPSPALRNGLLRTLALIRARTFTAKVASTRLHVTARVSPDEVHDGLHGEVFAIGGSFAAAEGQAFFALAIGRRIDLRVTE